jgi:hypothetical protein
MHDATFQFEELGPTEEFCAAPLHHGFPIPATYRLGLTDLLQLGDDNPYPGQDSEFWFACPGCAETMIGDALLDDAMGGYTE